MKRKYIHLKGYLVVDRGWEGMQGKKWGKRNMDFNHFYLRLALLLDTNAFLRPISCGYSS